jgi:hypothetical protein
MLSSIYQQWRGRGRTEITPIADAFYPPMLVRKPDEWTNATHRVAYIGQETLGWSWTQRDVAEYGYTWGYEDIETLHKFLEYDRSVEALIDGYGQFNFAARQPLSYRSPFWQYFRRLTASLGKKGDEVSAVFSNVIRCAANSEVGFTLWSISEKDRARYLQWQKGLLQAELTELLPTLIVFLTGPYYDDYLRSEFDEISFEPLGSFEPRVVSKLKSAMLTAPAYRTYHPGYLNRTVGFAPLEAIIADALKR